MISPDFRNTENPNLIEAYKTFIIQNHGNNYSKLSFNLASFTYQLFYR